MGWVGDIECKRMKEKIKEAGQNDRDESSSSCPLVSRQEDGRLVCALAVQCAAQNSRLDGIERVIYSGLACVLLLACRYLYNDGSRGVSYLPIYTARYPSSPMICFRQSPNEHLSMLTG
ncbi:hypothetical protein CBL_03194 [Carabus blaptoides fortunei]